MVSRICIISIYISYLLDTSISSRVIDAISQRSIFVSEYCPKTQYCKEGTHVMCMFYNKEKVMGPHCLNSPNITITPVLATKLLEISNAIRSKIALGKEKGKDGVPLPRAYGMLRLQWDEELATFAQVLANQCVLRHDICRATNTFPDPGQTAGLVRYTYPDWNSISKVSLNGDDNTPELTEKKLIYAIKQSTKSWYIQKTSVTPEMVIHYPDWPRHPTRHGGKLYLEMITGNATHMGCGMSAYTEYTYRNNFAALNYNSVQVICNFSARPVPGTSVYNTEPPSDAPPGTQCGCPSGYDEDEDCLCNENPNYSPVPKPKRSSCDGKNCVPPVVLLPIIAMEDAPPHKLLRYNNDTQEQLFESFDIFNDDSDNTIHVKEAHTHNDFEKTLREARNNLHKPRSLNELAWKPQNRYYAGNPIEMENRKSVQESLNHVRSNGKQNSKPSIFTKVTKFKLPNGPIKKDVLPRKDFTKVQSLVNTYLNKKRSANNLQLVSSDLDAKSHILLSPTSKNITLDEDYTKLINNTSHSGNEEIDRKVMHLLDNLEQEVKHVTLDESEKEILDNKLRKIYGRISNEPRDPISYRRLDNNVHKSKLQDADIEDFLKYENRVNEHLLNERSRNPDRYLRDSFNRRTIKDDGTLNIHKRLLQKDRDYSENLGTLRKRLEKPINENEYNNPDMNFNNRMNTRNMNALVEYDRNNINNYDNLNDDVNRRELRKSEIHNGRYMAKNDDERLRNYYLINHLDDEGQLNFKRRKYYQDKIDYLERKFQNDRAHRRHKKAEDERKLRPFQPDRMELPVRPSQTKTRKNPFYMPDRARSVHRFK